MEDEEMTPDFSKELRRFNYLLSETESAYHEAASRLGLPESSMMVLYAVCHAGTSCPLRDICRNAGVSKQTINPRSAGWRRKDSSIWKIQAAKIKPYFLPRKGKSWPDGPPPKSLP